MMMKENDISPKKRLTVKTKWALDKKTILNVFETSLENVGASGNSKNVVRTSGGSRGGSRDSLKPPTSLPPIFKYPMKMK